MATNPHTHDELGSLVISTSGELVCVIDNVSWEYAMDVVDVRGACRFGAYNQGTKDQATLNAKMFGAGTAGLRTSHLDLSAATLGGVDIIPVLYRFTLQGAFDKQPLPGIGVLGKAEGVTGKNYTGSLELQIDDSEVVQDIIIATEARTLAAKQMVLSVVINAKTLTFPVQLTGDTHASAAGEYQKVTVNFAGQAPAAPTAYPTAPSALPGSPTLLDWALLTPKTNMAFTFISKTNLGIERTGFLTWDGFNLTIADGEIVDYSYTWKTYGEFATALAEAA